MIIRLRASTLLCVFLPWRWRENRSADVLFLARTAVALANTRGQTSLKTQKFHPLKNACLFQQLSCCDGLNDGRGKTERTQSRFFIFVLARWNLLLHQRPCLVLNCGDSFIFVVYIFKSCCGSSSVFNHQLSELSRYTGVLLKGNFSLFDNTISLRSR